MVHAICAMRALLDNGMDMFHAVLCVSCHMLSIALSRYGAVVIGSGKTVWNEGAWRWHGCSVA